MRRFWFSFLGLCCFLALDSNAQTKKLCITIDDLTVVSYGINDSAFVFGITEGLLGALDTFDIPAIGYVNEQKLYTNGELDSLKLLHLKRWLDKGYDLGNHTFSHPSYHQIEATAYMEDILKGEQITKPLLRNYGKELKYFRHPYLHAGLNQSHSDSLENFLTDHGYITSPVTVDNTDYLFAKAYSDAYKSNDEVLMEKIGSAYMLHSEKKLIFFETLSKKVFDRDIAHTLLLHANFLNSRYLDDLAQMYKKYGYTFVSQEEVLKDPAYETEVSEFGDWGPPWTVRWAMTLKVEGNIFEGNPKVPEFIK